MKGWLRRLDRVAADLNVLLLIIAVGLGMLDLTVLVARRVADRLPEMKRVPNVTPPAPRNAVPGQPGFP